MPKSKYEDSTCNNCNAQVLPLHQSYVDGSYNCGWCALKLDPYLTEEMRQGIERRLRKSDQAKRNFNHSPAVAPAASLF